MSLRAGRAVVAGLLGVLLSGCQPGEAGNGASGSLPLGEGYDFFVLALSWSPSYCEAEGPDANRQQCDARKRHAFVVHGLWPQFERGWPEFCDTDEPRRVPETLIRQMIDIMPSAGLIGQQWRKHGSCAGMNQNDYFSVVRAAWERVAIPDRFDNARRTTIAPDEVERAFLEDNGGLPADGIAVTCDGRFVREVRICLTRQLDFRSCREVDARACRLPKALMPAAGG